MKSILNLLNYINENWTAILIMIGLLIGLYQKTVEFLRMSQEQRDKLVQTVVKEGILDIVAKAEKDYAETQQAGKIKRSQVINQLYQSYPILSKVSDQDALIKFIDKEIDNALDNIKGVFKAE